jgi:hypothetical protein
MAYTATQLQTLKDAYAAGLRRVRMSDGRELEYASLDEMAKAIDKIESTVEVAAGTRPARTHRAYTSKGV